MDYILVGKQFSAIIPIPESSSDDSVAYSIIKVSDGSEFDSGSAVYVSGNLWSVSFMPDELDQYVVCVTDLTIDSKRERSYKAVERISSKHLG